MPEVAGSRARGWLGIVSAGLLVVLFVVSISTSSWIGLQITRLVDRIAHNGWYGELVFLAAFSTVCLTGIIPASMLAVVAGTFYGLRDGTLLSAAGLSIGGVVGFVAARFLFRDMARGWVDRRLSLRKIDADIARQGWKIVALMRLSPVAPFGITSYALGLTRLRLVDYLLGTIGSLPAMVAYVYIGVLAHTALHASSGAMIPWIKLLVMGAGVAATIVTAIHFYGIVAQAGTEDV